MNNPNEKPRTRCKISSYLRSIDRCLLFLGDELKQTVSIVVDLASVLDPDGVDVYFLNREPMLHVRNSSELETVFAMDPEGRFYPHPLCQYRVDQLQSRFHTHCACTSTSAQGEA